MKKILVPTDFSQNSKHAVQIAAKIAAQTGASLEIMHANIAIAYMPVMPEYYSPKQLEVENYGELAAADLDLLKQELSTTYGVDVTTRVKDGFLHSAINAVKEEDGCDLVVMGTKGANGAVEFFVGSNTEKVIRTAHCPVLAVPEGVKEVHLNTVVLATSLRPDQAVGFEELAKWQRIYDFEVKILYLNNPGGYDSMTEIEAAAMRFCMAAGVQHADVLGASNTFNEEQTILRFADEIDADMIVMVTHQRQGLSHLMFGSLTEDTANHSVIPVLCVPALR